MTKEVNIIKRQYKYMVEDTEGINRYLITESEREGIIKNIKKGILEGRVRDFIYKVNISFSLNCKSNINDLSAKAKKVIYKIISELIFKHGVGNTSISETISLYRGDFGLSIADLKSFKAPLFRNCSTCIIIDVNSDIEFEYKPLCESIEESYVTGKYIHY